MLWPLGKRAAVAVAVVDMEEVVEVVEAMEELREGGRGVVAAAARAAAAAAAAFLSSAAALAAMASSMLPCLFSPVRRGAPLRERVGRFMMESGAGAAGGVSSGSGSSTIMSLCTPGVAEGATGAAALLLLLLLLLLLGPAALGGRV